MSKPEIDELPLYFAYLMMGAISCDKTNLKLSEADGLAYQMAMQKRREK